MGVLITKSIHYFKNQSKLKIAIIGLEHAGKTTICYKLIPKSQNFTPIVSLQSNIQYEYENMSILDIDLIYHKNLIMLAKYHMKDAGAIIFVLDCNDQERFDEAREKLFEFTNLTLDKRLPLLIFANKQDLKNSVSDIEIIKKLELSKLKNISVWNIQNCTAITSDGLQQGIDLLQDMLKNNQ